MKGNNRITISTKIDRPQDYKYSNVGLSRKTSWSSETNVGRSFRKCKYRVMN